eukprot:gene26600-18382_t
MLAKSCQGHSLSTPGTATPGTLRGEPTRGFSPLTFSLTKGCDQSKRGQRQGHSLPTSGTANPIPVRSNSNSHRSKVILRCSRSSTPGPDLSSLAEKIGTAWDPEGLLPPMGNAGMDHFARKMRGPTAPVPTSASSSSQQEVQPTTPQQPYTSAAAATPQASPAAQPPSRPGPTPPSTPLGGPSSQDTVEPLPQEALQQGGLSPADLSAEKRAELEFRLQSEYMTVDLSTPGLKVLCLDPPIFTVDNFFPEASCDNLVAAAQESGKGARLA